MVREDPREDSCWNILARGFGLVLVIVGGVAALVAVIS